MRGRESITYDFNGIRSAGGAFIPWCSQVAFFLPVPLRNTEHGATGSVAVLREAILRDERHWQPDQVRAAFGQRRS